MLGQRRCKVHEERLRRSLHHYQELLVAEAERRPHQPALAGLQAGGWDCQQAGGLEQDRKELLGFREPAAKHRSRWRILVCIAICKQFGCVQNELPQLVWLQRTRPGCLQGCNLAVQRGC